MSTTFLGGVLLAAPFAAAVATGITVGFVSIVVTDVAGLARRLVD